MLESHSHHESPNRDKENDFSTAVEIIFCVLSEPCNVKLLKAFG